MVATEASGQENLNRLDSSFMSSILCKEIILEINENNEKNVQELVACCQTQELSQCKLELFQRDYHQKSAIWWHPCEIFLHNMLNRALRSDHWI